MDSKGDAKAGEVAALVSRSLSGEGFATVVTSSATGPSGNSGALEELVLL